MDIKFGSTHIGPSWRGLHATLHHPGVWAELIEVRNGRRTNKTLMVRAVSLGDRRGGSGLFMVDLVTQDNRRLSFLGFDTARPDNTYPYNYQRN